ncbi:hypothetical protein ACFQZ4_50560 [Catellatospora coxensis]|uniref:Uncharacterized protein n=1 Tax=Catellatospora coxensis TaxID=310354 RepID=A0A8J3KQ15_9ACTN|nr:hypothetical protein [Catellatospora coxensis]GIG05090.1 hypothetical protein Cco03nite_17900 [Catellatospora coxensis]
MEFPSRADYPLVDAEGLLQNPAFWPLHLHWAHDIHDLMSRLDVDGGDMDVLADQLIDPERWPFFRLPTADGGELVIIYRNFADDSGIDFERHQADGAITNLAAIEGDWPARVFDWDELLQIATNPRRGAGVTEPVDRFLLLLPLLADAPGDASDQVRRAFGARTALAETAGAILERSPHW